jgi:hypothetical protein
MTDKATETRRRLFEDFEFYAKHCISIRTKEGKKEPLVLNRAQRKLLDVIERQMRDTGRVRVIILKARQQGFSTLVHAWLYWRLSQRKAKKGLVIAHKADSTLALWTMYTRTHASCPEAVRPSTKAVSRKELVFDVLDTGLMVATAGGEGVARGETITHCHRSEVAFWPKATADDNMNALNQTIPNKPDTADFIESTANGMSGIFYEMWRASEKGETGYECVFSPWFDTDEYRVPAPADLERTIEEEGLVERYGLDNEQLMFRRQKIGADGRDKFLQEYPACPEEAFLASGRPVFEPEQITTMLQNRPPILAKMTKEGPTFAPFSRGELTVYREKEPAGAYYIGADVAMGLKNGDYSVAQVLDTQKRQVAIWRGHVDPDYFADVLFSLGNYFNEARLAVENNSHGLLTAVRLGRDLAYPNIYTEVGEGKLEDTETISIGFRTSARTKPLILDRLRASLREGEIEINDETTLREMRSFIVTESGTMKAEQGKFDDCVMALAIANHIHDGKFTPIVVTDEFYEHAL